jgi:hypothetical protein
MPKLYEQQLWQLPCRQPRLTQTSSEFAGLVSVHAASCSITITSLKPVHLCQADIILSGPVQTQLCQLQNGQHQWLATFKE